MQRQSLEPAGCSHRHLPQGACGKKIVRGFNDVELKPWHSYGALVPTPHDVGAFSPAMTFAKATYPDYLANKLKPDEEGDIDFYAGILKKVGAVNSIMRIASDAMEDYFGLLYAKNTAAIDTCLSLATKGAVYFEGIPRDIQGLLLRRMAGTVKTDLGFMEKDVDLEFNSREKLGGFFVVKASTYDEIFKSVTSLSEVLSVTDSELAEVMTAETAQGVQDKLQTHVWSKRRYPEVFKSRVELFFRTHAMLIRSLEVARRRAAGPINAIAQALWRKGEIASKDILPKPGRYALMSHSGASAKTATEDGGDGKELRKTKARAILLKVEVVQLSHKVPKNQKDPTLIKVKVKKVNTYFVSVKSKQYYEGSLVKAGKRSRYDAVAKKDRSMQGVVRLYLRTEGPELDASVKAATANLKNLFIGLLIADHGRWV